MRKKYINSNKTDVNTIYYRDKNGKILASSSTYRTTSEKKLSKFSLILGLLSLFVILSSMFLTGYIDSKYENSYVDEVKVIEYQKIVGYEPCNISRSVGGLVSTPVPYVHYGESYYVDNVYLNLNITIDELENTLSLINYDDGVYPVFATQSFVLTILNQNGGYTISFIDLSDFTNYFLIYNSDYGFFPEVMEGDEKMNWFTLFNSNNYSLPINKYLVPLDDSEVGWDNHLLSYFVSITPFEYNNSYYDGTIFNPNSNSTFYLNHIQFDEVLQEVSSELQFTNWHNQRFYGISAVYLPNEMPYFLGIVDWGFDTPVYRLCLCYFDLEQFLSVPIIPVNTDNMLSNTLFELFSLQTISIYDFGGFFSSQFKPYGDDSMIYHCGTQNEKLTQLISSTPFELASKMMCPIYETYFSYEYPTGYYDYDWNGKLEQLSKLRNVFNVGMIDFDKNLYYVNNYKYVRGTKNDGLQYDNYNILYNDLNIQNLLPYCSVVLYQSWDEKIGSGKRNDYYLWYVYLNDLDDNATDTQRKLWNYVKDNYITQYTLNNYINYYALKQYEGFYKFTQVLTFPINVINNLMYDFGVLVRFIVEW